MNVLRDIVRKSFYDKYNTFCHNYNVCIFYLVVIFLNNYDFNYSVASVVEDENLSGH